MLKLKQALKQNTLKTSCLTNPIVSFLVLALAIGQFASNSAAASESGPNSNTSTGVKPLSNENQKGELTPGDIFQSVFGRKMEALPAANYPVILDNVNIGDMRAKPSDSIYETEFDAKELKELILPYLTDVKALELNKLLSQRKTITISDLSLSSLSINFDTSTQAIYLSIPLDFRSEFPIPVYRRNNPTIGVDYLTSSKFSAIANAYGSANIANKSEFLDKNQTNENVGIETAIRWNDIVFETGANYASGANEKLTFRNTRFVKDLVDERLRLQAGDLYVSNRALQSQIDAFGFSISRYFGTKPYTSIRPNPSRSFVVKGGARVSIYINGRLSKEVRLAAGRYSLQDLPLRSSSGNDIRLIINYDSGETEQLLFNAFYDFDLLLKGTSEFATSIGVRSQIVNGKRDYQEDKPILSTFYRRGFSDTLSLGINAQAENNYVNIGLEGLLTTGIGSFGVFSNASSSEGNTGDVLSIFYRLNHFFDDGMLSLNLQNEFTDANYRTIVNSDKQPEYTNHITGNMTYDSSAGYSLSTTYEKKTPIQEIQDETRISASLTFGSRLGSISLSGRLDETSEGRTNSWGITLNTAFDFGSSSLAYQSNDPYYRFGFANPPQAGAYSIGYDVAHTKRAEHDQSRLGLSYAGNRFDSRLEFNVADGQNSLQYGDEVNTTLFFSTALVYADGKSALSRPVDDSFAIFPANKGAEKFKLGVDPQSSFWTDNNRYHAWSDALGPPVVNNLNSYHLRHITVDAPFAPAGTSIGSQAYSILPGYRSGLAIPVGSDENAAIIGSIVDKNNNIVPFAVGYTLGNNGDKNNFFTNGGGRFYVASLRAGSSVELVFTHPVSTTVNISIPENTVGIFRIEKPIVLPYLKNN